MRFRAKNGAIWELITLLRTNQIARIASDFKVDVIKMIMMMIDANDDYSLFQILLFRVEKTDDISQLHRLVSLEIKSEERAQKFHSDDVHYADLGSTSDWSCHVGIWPQPIRRSIQT